MPCSTHLSNILLDRVFRGTAYPSKPSTLYFALFTVAPTAAGGGTEVTDGSYARAAVAATSAKFTMIATPGASNLLNTAIIQWPRATADWGTVAAWGIYDAATSGNLLFFDDLAAPLAVINGQRPQVAANAISISLSGGGYSDYIEQKLLNHVFAGQAFPTISSHYFALGKTGISSSTGLTTEAAGSGYSRLYKPNTSATYAAASAGEKSNSSTITTWTFSANPLTGAATHFAIYTAATGGTFLWGGEIPSITLASGDYSWDIGELVLTLN